MSQHGLAVEGADDDDDAGACLFASDVGAQTPSESLAKLWASQANSIPTAFWMLAHLHAAGNEVHLERAVRAKQHVLVVQSVMLSVAWYRV